MRPSELPKGRNTGIGVDDMHAAHPFCRIRSQLLDLRRKRHQSSQAHQADLKARMINALRRSSATLLAATLMVCTTAMAVLGYTPPRILVTESGGSTSVAESGTTDTFEVVLLEQPASDVVIDLASLDTGEVTAQGPAIPANQLHFEPGTWAIPQTVTVTGVDDTTIDGDQTTQINLSVNDALSDDAWDTEPDQGVIVTTTDDDVPEITFSARDFTATEGADIQFTVTMSSAYSSPVTVNYETSDWTAVEGLEYVGQSGILTFDPGDPLSQVIQVTGIDDANAEYVETFTMHLSNPVNATIALDVAVGIINDDDPDPSISISDATLSEGDSGSSDAIFTVSLSAASARTVTVDYHTTDDTATAPDDYTPIGTTTLTFDPWQSSHELTVLVAGDVLDESNETFEVELSNPVNATLADISGLGTIVDDDVPEITFSARDFTATEGADIQFTVTMSSAYSSPVTVNYETSDWTAVEGLDYVARSGVLTFNPGDPLGQVIQVTGVDDASAEYVETFSVHLSNPVNATIALDVAVGIINDDDPDPSVSISDATLSEGNTGFSDAIFTVSLSVASGKTITVDYHTTDGTATAPDDYTSIPATSLTFDPGVAAKLVAVQVIGDSLHESNETFSAKLSNPSNATIVDDTAVGTIVNDDPEPLLSIADATVVEGDSGGAEAHFTVMMSAPSSKTVTVQYMTVDGTAVATSDYTPIGPITLTFDPGDLMKIVTVQILGDVLPEADETFTVQLSSPVNIAISDASGLGTIVNDDVPEMDVQRPAGTSIADGAQDALASWDVGAVTLTYVIDNAVGKDELTVPAGGVTASHLMNCGGFSVQTPLPIHVAAGGTATLQIALEIVDPYVFSLDMNINNNDENENPYMITILGFKPGALEIIPLGAAGDNLFLDRGLDLSEGETPPLIGMQPLAAAYEVGEPVTGACMICDHFGVALWSSWIHVFVYAVNPSAEPESVQLHNHWVVHHDREERRYIFTWDTKGCAAGWYDIHLAFPDGSARTVRVQLVAPAS